MELTLAKSESIRVEKISLRKTKYAPTNTHGLTLSTKQNTLMLILTLSARQIRIG